MASLTARTVLVSDLHSHVINLARVVADPTLNSEMRARLATLPFHPDVLRDAQEYCQWPEEGEDPDDPLEWAINYFVASWMSRNGTAGTAREFESGLSVRWTASGGDSATRFRNATESLAEWQTVLARCSFVKLDVFDFLDRVQDRPRHGIYCLLPDSQVRMSDESIKSIVDVRAGDVVAPGRNVLRTFVRDYQGEALRIKVQGLPDKLNVTSEHPILRIPGRIAGAKKEKRTPEEMWGQRSVVPASELNVGDLVIIPVGGAEIVPPNFEAKYLCKPNLRGPQPRQISVHQESAFFRLLGYYAAEGHTFGRSPESHRAIFLSFGLHEIDTLAADSVKCVKEATGLTAVVAPGKPHASVVTVRVYSTVLTNIIRSLVSGTAKNKCLAPELMSAPISLQRELLIGWLRGDGCFEAWSRGRIRLNGTSASETLARQMFQIAIRCGLRPSFKRRVANFDVYFAAEDAASLGWPVKVKKFRSTRRIIHGHSFARVREIERHEYSGPVHNIEVDGDHLFCAPFALVHNCDPPFPGPGDSYKHTFDEKKHRAMAGRLTAFQNCKVLLRYYDHPLIREIYPEDRWEWTHLKGRKSTNEEAPEVLICKGGEAS